MLNYAKHSYKNIIRINTVKRQLYGLEETNADQVNDNKTKPIQHNLSYRV